MKTLLFSISCFLILTASACRFLTWFNSGGCVGYRYAGLVVMFPHLVSDRRRLLLIVANLHMVMTE